MSNIEVLISAMHQKDDSIFGKTNIRSDALMINQCDNEECHEKIFECGKARTISTIERGLSRSRNMALKNANGDVCLICDDDEILDDNYPELILSAYEKNPKADLICFQVQREGKKYSKKSYKVGYLRSLKIASWQITFKKKSILDNGLTFDENFGSGTPKGSGEENIFLFDCLKKGLSIYYVPVCIGRVGQVKSNWFKGFNELYFYNRGQIINRLLGKSIGSLYCLYFAISKYSQYKMNLSIGKAISALFRGMREEIK